MKLWLDERFQVLLGYRLRNPILYRRNSELARSSAGFGDSYPANRLGKIRS
jgi:hypothetical protein